MALYTTHDDAWKKFTRMWQNKKELRPLFWLFSVISNHFNVHVPSLHTYYQSNVILFMISINKYMGQNMDWNRIFPISQELN